MFWYFFFLTLVWLYLVLGHGFFWMVRPFLLQARNNLTLWPKVAVIIPARNEAAALPATLSQLALQDYPGALEIVVVDDASTDGTALVAEELLKKSLHPYRLLSALPLPKGWSGKVWAMENGFQYLLKGELPEYILLTDADIYHPIDSLKNLVYKAQTERRDMVSLMVKLKADSFWERLLIPAFVFFFQMLYPFRRVNDNNSFFAGAAGGCILIRAEKLKSLGGFKPIYNRLIDDCSLARQVKKTGGSLWLGFTNEVLSLRDYKSLAPIWKMVTRTAYTQLFYSPWLLALTVMAMGGLFLSAPLLSFWGLAQGQTGLWIWGLGLWSAMGLVYSPMLRFYRQPFYFAWLLPFIALLYSLMTLDSARLYYCGKGGGWKNRTY
jgi:hopene-associated glycosyltransferase HpnB